MIIRLFLVIAFALVVNTAQARTVAPVVVPEVIREISHDSRAFTQGLFFYKGKLYESTGKHGRSELRELDPDTGRVIDSVALPARFFGEGAAVAHGEMLWLTWQKGKAFTVQGELERLVERFGYSGEGWGLTFNGEQWVMSNGSATLKLRRTDDFSVVGKLLVRDGDKPIRSLNELEWFEGYIFANVWRSTRIAIIDSESGMVAKWLELRALVPVGARPDAVLNGIAVLPHGKSLFVTGKLWPVMYEIRMPTLP